MQEETAGRRSYMAIDLKSFYASVECVARGYNPLTTNLVVADASRTEKTICLAVSPSLKAVGLPGRARLFEVVQRVKEVNQERRIRARRLGVALKGGQFSASSFDAPSLEADPSLELAYLVATPRMRLYEEISTRVYSIYMKYVSPEDIHVYSIDEVFIDATSYLETYGKTAHELAMEMIREVLRQTGITATAGIGPNLYLAKVAMDIVAKHVPADAQGVRIAQLDERSYREKLWCHTPLTDFWRVGKGIAKRLEGLGCTTMGDVARLSERNEEALYGALGITAELLIDHAWGYEPTTISHIKSYKPENNSISSGQVLSCPYDWEKGKLIVREMTELLALDLVRREVVTRKLELTISYDRSSIALSYQGRTPQENDYRVTRTGKRYQGKVGFDAYGRPCPVHAHGTGNLDHWTSSSVALTRTMMELYDRIVDPDLYLRKVTVVAVNILREEEVPAPAPQQLDLFTDYEALEKERQARETAEKKEKRLQKATLALQERFGKNVLLKGMNLLEGGTTIARNGQIGGHRAGEEK